MGSAERGNGCVPFGTGPVALLEAVAAKGVVGSTFPRCTVFKAFHGGGDGGGDKAMACAVGGSALLDDLGRFIDFGTEGEGIGDCESDAFTKTLAMTRSCAGLTPL